MAPFVIEVIRGTSMPIKDSSYSVYAMVSSRRHRRTHKVRAAPHQLLARRVSPAPCVRRTLQTHGGGSSDPLVVATLFSDKTGARQQNHLSRSRLAHQLAKRAGKLVGQPRRSLTKLATTEPVWRFFADFDLPAEDHGVTHVLLDVFDYDLDAKGSSSEEWCAAHPSPLPHTHTHTHSGNRVCPPADSTRLGRVRMCCCKIALSDLTAIGALFASTTQAEGRYQMARPSETPLMDMDKDPTGKTGYPMLEVRLVPSAGMSNELTLFMIRHGESEWNDAQKHHNFIAQLKQVLLRPSPEIMHVSLDAAAAP